MTGCLTRVAAAEEQPAAAPAADSFLLTHAGDDKTTYRLMAGRDDVDLSKHVGQQVELRGFEAPATASRNRGDDHERVQGGQMQDVGQAARGATAQRQSSATVAKAEADATPQLTLRVTAMKTLAKTCTAAER